MPDQDFRKVIPIVPNYKIDSHKPIYPYTVPEWPPEEERKDLFTEAIEDANRHKWIESENARRDLGESAYRDWFKRYWKQFCRERLIQHIKGEIFWYGLGINDDFGAINSYVNNNHVMFDQIIQQYKKGADSIDLLRWAANNKQDTNLAGTIVQFLDEKQSKIQDKLNCSEEDFLARMHSRVRPRIMIVEDAVDARDTLAKWFKEKNIDVVAVGCGAEALNKVQTRSFDLFLIDLALPDKLGAEIAWHLHRHRIKAPVIALSGVLDSWTEADLQDCGFSYSMAKPAEQEKIYALADKVNAAWDNRNHSYEI